MPLLLSATDFAPYKELSSNLDDGVRLHPYIAQAQQFDLKPLIGELFYKNLVDNQDSTPHTLLLAGGGYGFDGNTYEFSGLKAVLVFFAYARFLENQNINITRFGVVYKNNSDVSERVDEKTLQRLINQAREQALAYWAECVMFLNRKRSSYPFWKGRVDAAKQGLRITAVG